MSYWRASIKSSPNWQGYIATNSVDRLFLNCDLFLEIKIELPEEFYIKMNTLVSAVDPLEKQTESRLSRPATQRIFVDDNYDWRHRTRIASLVKCDGSAGVACERCLTISMPPANNNRAY